ncbi:MAG: polyketide synthase dehydratase domain-containing protein [Acidobacteriia bacterium]|nr:polyketide synthase dehydratase domain-containing protein [Terriglobia bacterium]
MPTEPIAIVGQSCVLPQALTPGQLWTNVISGRNCLSRVPAGRWGVPRSAAMGTSDEAADRTWTDVGGYVNGFESVFDPAGFLLPAEEILALDPLFQWVLHGTREALRGIGHESALPRAGLVLGGLSFPTSAMARYAESVWLEAQGADFAGGRAAQHPVVVRPHARNRFSSGLPAHLAARALGLGAGSFALDAACASSLYAIKHACDRLHDGTADVMVAGAVSRTDDLFTHIGFCALGAMSHSGRSRPFHRDADGLVPAEGAGFIVLQRLRDAVAAGRHILGVIRAVGLSNDGRGRGLLAPSEEGQERAMRQAYAAAGVTPKEIALVECHATGTQVGDATEVRSMGRVFEGCDTVPIGSLKSNLGHLVAAAGVAGLMKVLAALEHGQLPPTLHADAPMDALRSSPFRLLHEVEVWTGPRRAAISAFGFGGNNAHLIVEAWEKRSAMVQVAMPAGAPAQVAIVGIGARVADGESADDFARALFEGKPCRDARASVSVALEGLKFPPHDLAQALPQQTLVLEAAREAADGVMLPRERTAVMIGMGCDPELARYGARWQLRGWAEKWLGNEGGLVDPVWLDEARAAFQSKLEAAGVLGAMPNIVANRINGQLDVAGPSCTVAAEEASGIVAMELAARALRAGEIDAAVIGAVDPSHEIVHCAALKELGKEKSPGDAAVVLVLKRLADARRDGDEVYAVVGEAGPGALVLGDVEPGSVDLGEMFGHAHAANGLLHVAAGALALRHRTKPGADSVGNLWAGEPAAVRVNVSVLEAPPVSIGLLADSATAVLSNDSVNGNARAVKERPSSTLTTGRASGARLTLSAHRGVPRLPRLDVSGQVMERAPALPPAWDSGSASGPDSPARETLKTATKLTTLGNRTPQTESQPALMSAQARNVAARTSTAGATAVQTSLRESAPDLSTDVMARLAAHQKQLGVLHRAFLAQQSEVHQSFLVLRQKQEAALLAAYGTAVNGTATSVAAAADVRAPMPLASILPATKLPPSQPTASPNGAQILPGPKYNRGQLEVLACGRISLVFGKLFEAQDEYHRQVRMPEPPLLLADRVTGIDAIAGSMGTGALWTETDVRADSWYLDAMGRMPAGIMIEAGQADLLLISWLGVDLLNRGERVYRLLGCELTFHGSLCLPGDTLAFEIHIDSHAKQGDVRLFFFHYDCHVNGELRFAVRNAQAGFFTDQELLNSGGVLWDLAEDPYRGEGALDPPVVVCQRRAFDRAALRSFADGQAFDCFGLGWEPAQAHVRTPRISAGKMLFLDRVTDFNPRGGPWGRGYLRAETPVTPNDWFFAGHFKNDPCMPGTLMFEGSLQALSFYLAAMGFTVERDGWIFEPVPDQKYSMRCRGQVTPTNKQIVYEVFVSEVIAGPLPTVFADLLCTVDGLKVFHARQVGVRLAPDWPLEHWRKLSPAKTQLSGDPVPLHRLGGLRGFKEPKPPASVNGFEFGYVSLLACAWGKPTTAFGPSYASFNGPRRVPRLPGPPYHFMSRVSWIDAPMSGMKQGSVVEVEYDLPAEQWYFEQNGNPTVPSCVLMEAALQPCGWIALFVGSALNGRGDLLFRNLDGTSKLSEELFPAAGTLRTRVKLTSVSQTTEMTIESFAVECFLGDRRVYEMNTVCGIFPPEAFASQVGLPASTDERTRLAAPSEFMVELSCRPPRYCAGELRLPGPMLLMLDRVTGYWPGGGRAGLGYLRAEKDVDPAEWFFKAHFFQDPVQPGSLGIEAMCQLLQFYMLECEMGVHVPHPRFEPIMVGRALTWKFRGQVTPASHRITVELEITEAGDDSRGAFAIAEAWLWADGKRIYHAKDLGMRIVAGASAFKKRNAAGASEQMLDPATDLWLADHCPTWTFPVLPMMSMVDRMAEAAAAHAGREVTGLESVQLQRWLAFPGGPVRLRADVTGVGETRNVTLLAWRDATDATLSRFEPVATGLAQFGSRTEAPPPFAPLTDALPVPDPYASGGLFHGPAFQYLTELRVGANGASAILRAERGSVPRGYLHQGLLDAATHAIPHDALWQWSTEIPHDQAPYPYRIPELHLHGPLPDAGEIQLEARFAGFDGGPRFPAMDIQLISAGRVLVSFRLVEILLPKGPIGTASPEARRAFLRDRLYVPGVALSRFDGTTTRLTGVEVRQSDWLPGNVARIYAVPSAGRENLVAEVAVREHVARRAFVHPSSVTVEPDFTAARAAMRPLRRHAVHLSIDRDEVAVTDAGPPAQDLTSVRHYWRERIGIGPWPVEDLYYGLIERFVGDVVLVDPEAFARVRGRSCLYLGNHQVGIESLLFSVLISALSATPAVTLAKAEHKTSWLGWLIAHSFSFPGVSDPNLITFFEREDRESLMKIVSKLGMEMRSRGKSAMVHVEGTRSLACRRPVVKMSSAFIDLALAVGAPIIPVRFVGGLPVAEVEKRLEFPAGFGRQDYWLGKPIFPEELAALPYKDRKEVVIAAINGLGPDVMAETPSEPNLAFSAAVHEWIVRTGSTPEDAVFFTTLAMLAEPGDEVRALCDGARQGKLVVGSGERAEWLVRFAERLFGPDGPQIIRSAH